MKCENYKPHLDSVLTFKKQGIEISRIDKHLVAQAEEDTGECSQTSNFL